MLSRDSCDASRENLEQGQRRELQELPGASTLPAIDFPCCVCGRSKNGIAVPRRGLGVSGGSVGEYGGISRRQVVLECLTKDLRLGNSQQDQVGIWSSYALHLFSIMLCYPCRWKRSLYMSSIVMGLPLELIALPPGPKGVCGTRDPS